MATSRDRSPARDSRLDRQSSNSNVGAIDQAPPSPKSRTQTWLGLIYVLGFLIIIGGVITFTLIQKYKVAEIKELLLAISGILSGPLGFIIGFYFKEEVQNRENL